MSRHVLRSDDSYTVVVGYDDPIDSYFAQVYDIKAEKADPDGYEHLVVQTGDRPCEVTDAIVCIESVASYINLDGDRVREIALQLHADRAHRRPPTQFQRDNWKRFFDEELP